MRDLRMEDGVPTPDPPPASYCIYAVGASTKARHDYQAETVYS